MSATLQSHPPKHGFSTLATKGSSDAVGPMGTTSLNNDIDIREHVQLLSDKDIVLETATTIGGSQLHGNTLPPTLVRVVIEEITSNVHPTVTSAFDDEMLTVGSITAWPLDRIRKLNIA